MNEHKLSLSISITADIRSTELTEWTPTQEEFIERFKAPVISPNKLDVRYIVRAQGNQRKDSALADTASILILDCDSHINDDGEIVDGAPPFDDVGDVLEANNIPFIAHTTYSNTASTLRYRFIILCEYEREHLKPLLHSVHETLHQAGVMLANVKENATWSQGWFLPSLPNKKASELFRCRHFFGVNHV